MNSTKKMLEEMTSSDAYSLIFFVLYKLRDIPEYSTLSELMLMFDKDSVTKFLKYYGGMTIRIPTEEELNLVINVLLMYIYINVNGEPRESAMRHANLSSYKKRDVNDVYDKLSSILENYDFMKENKDE